MADRHDQELRAALRYQLIEQGLPREHVDEIVDLAFHAASSATAALYEVLQRASGYKQMICATGIAVGIARAQLEGIEEGVKTLGAELGMRVGSLTIGGE